MEGDEGGGEVEEADGDDSGKGEGWGLFGWDDGGGGYLGEGAGDAGGW